MAYANSNHVKMLTALTMAMAVLAAPAYAGSDAEEV